MPVSIPTILDKTCWDKLGNHAFFHITANFFKRKVLPRSPLTMLSIRDLTLHSGPKTTLKGGRGGRVPKYKRNVQKNSFVQDCSLS